MLAKIFTFPYYDQGTIKQLNVPTAERLTPIRPVISALGIDMNTARDNAKKLPHELIKVQGTQARETLCLKPEHILTWLNNIRRCKDPAKLLHFQKNYVPALQQFLEEVSRPVAPRRQLPVKNQVEYLNEAQALRRLQEQEPIYLDTQPLDSEGRARLLCNQMGVTDAETINYFVRTKMQLYFMRPSREDNPRPFEEWAISLSAINSYNAKMLREHDWDLAPIFFFKYPYLYQRKLFYFRTPKLDEKGNPINDTYWKEYPQHGCPWYCKEFAAKIEELISYKEEHEQQAKDEMVHQIATGKISVFDLFSDYFIHEENHEPKPMAIPAPTQSSFQPQTIVCPPTILVGS